MEIQSRQLAVLALAQPLAAASSQVVAAPASGATIVVWSNPTLDDWVSRVALTLRSSHDSAANGVIPEVTFDKGVSWVPHPDATTPPGFSASTDVVATYDYARIGDGMRFRYVNSLNALTTWTGEVRAYAMRAVAK